MIFKQGEVSESYYVIIRGLVGLKSTRAEFGFVPVNLKTCYDGDYFGALAHFAKTETLTQEKVDELNKQKSTAVALEECDVLEIKKSKSNDIINNSLSGQFTGRINFLR